LLKTGTGGLLADSIALVYQVAALDASRVVGKLNKLSADELRPIREGLRLMLKT
jgi:mRNA-degrading endonuclease toxin of MazEF toxin-antitoxin module